MVEVEFGVAGREQHVLFQRHQLDRVQGRGVVPGQMHMGFGHARHQSGAGGIDHLHACNRCRASAARYARDAIALDQNLARIGLGAGAVDDPNIREQNIGHGLRLQFNLAALLRVELAQDIDAFVGLFERRLVSATAQHFDGAAGDLFAHGAHRRLRRYAVPRRR